MVPRHIAVWEALLYHKPLLFQLSNVSTPSTASELTEKLYFHRILLERTHFIFTREWEGKIIETEKLNRNRNLSLRLQSSKIFESKEFIVITAGSWKESSIAYSSVFTHETNLLHPIHFLLAEVLSGCLELSGQVNFGNMLETDMFPDPSWQFYISITTLDKFDKILYTSA